VSPRTVVPIEATRDLFVLPGFPYEWDTPYFGVRTDRWKYVKWEANAEKGRPEEEELYDLLNDPNELENLAGSSDPFILDLLADLRAKAQVLKTCTGETCWTGQS
jgi:arylsulfatase A-like enzyme